MKGNAKGSQPSGYDFYHGTPSTVVGGHNSPPKSCPPKGPYRIEIQTHL